MTGWLEQTPGWGVFGLFFISAVVLLFIVLGFVTYAILFERKVIGWIQNRPGPNRVGPWGLLQTVADVMKLLIKEDVVPSQADRTLFKIAPVVAFVPSFLVLATIPYSEHIGFADLNVGLLYYAAISGITIIGILMGGWSSNNKYALIGGMRAVAQMISYEIPLILSVVGVILLSGSLGLRDIVHAQQEMGIWFVIPQILGFFVFLIAAVAELSRTPFDLPEAESELVAGYFVEYSGFRFAFFMLAEYVYVFAISCLVTLLYFGGWLPLIPFLSFIPGLIWFILKFSCMVFFLYWLRATMPRMRVDQLMGFGWKVLLPLALLNILITAVVKTMVM